LEGRFGGIGAQLEKDAEGNYILLPLPNHPASNAGVIEGDRLVKVDDLVITPETSMDVILAALRGKVDTVVNISVTRPPDLLEFKFSIKRAEISLPSVISYLAPTNNRLGVVKVNIMAATTPDEIEKAVFDLRERGAEAFALDLRDNFGGLLDSGIDTARLFLVSGEIMQQKYKGESVKTYSVNTAGPLSEIPFVILVNQNTASAAEIAAGALQSQQRALLIGTHTYGKDSIQLVFELRDKSSLQVTAARWWVPDENGEIPESIAGVGLQPDILVEISETDGPDPVILAAIETLLNTP
jgi:carboxyl-terminal processing protease